MKPSLPFEALTNCLRDRLQQHACITPSILNRIAIDRPLPWEPQDSVNWYIRPIDGLDPEQEATLKDELAKLQDECLLELGIL